MDREISTGAMMGIMLLTLAAVISIGFGVFEIARGVAETGTVNMQQSLSTVSNQEFATYDDKVVTGEQVLSAVKNFTGKPYAILIRTSALASGQDIAGPSVHPNGIFFVGATGALGTTRVYLDYDAILNGQASGGAPENPTPYAESNAALTTFAGLTPTSISGAISESDAYQVGTTTLLAGIPDLVESNGSYVYNNGLYTVKGNVVYNEEFGGLYTHGNAEYVHQNSEFQANLLENKAGDYVGIVFRQINNNGQ